jgi:hypothetical protein
MSTAPALPDQEFEAADIMRGLYGDGIIGLKGAFSREWAARMREDIDRLFEEARQIPGGALPRGPERFYVEVHPERIRGFVDIATHPWFVPFARLCWGRTTRSSKSGSTSPFPAPPINPGIATSPRPKPL